MIKLIILDVDGCLNSGNILYAPKDSEFNYLNIKDELGISTWIKIGNEVAIISNINSNLIQNKFKELGVKYYFNEDDKTKVLKEISSSLKLKNYEIAVIGDDLDDYSILKLAGRSFAPNNSVDDIKNVVDTVLNNDGGNGAVREMIDILVEENDQKDDFLGIWK